MARFYSDENIALQIVAALRRLGHDVLTSLEAEQANAGVPDIEVLAFATGERLILPSNIRRHFLLLHRHRVADHAGVVLCTFDPDFARQATRIHDSVTARWGGIGSGGTRESGGSGSAGSVLLPGSFAAVRQTFAGNRLPRVRISIICDDRSFESLFRDGDTICVMFTRLRQLVRPKDSASLCSGRRDCAI